MAQRLAVGIDYGTESVRVVVVDAADGRVVGHGARAYAHGVIDGTLPTGETLPADYALQHPTDWLTAAGEACRAAVAGIDVSRVVGVGVDFTSCTMLPCLRDGTPLCLTGRFSRVPLAWPKLWKHHGAKEATDRINRVARERGEAWLGRYGGVIGLEWFFPKVLETLTESPEVYDAAEVWLEAGDWLVWQLVSGPHPACDVGGLARSTCQAGYKGMWNRAAGFPSRAFFEALDVRLADVVQRKMPGRMAPPGTRAGGLTDAAAALLGLPAGTPVGAAIIDAHAGVPGAGAADAGTLVLVMGTSSCHMINGAVEALVPGVAGVVEDGILPGFFGYETGQASVGDAFGWAAKTFGMSHAELNARAAAVGPGSGGVLAVDWLNGCRTPVMDGRLSGGFVGITLGTRPEQMYRALMEATAFGVRWIVETLEKGGVAVNKLVASGGLPAKSPLLMQIYADVLGKDLRVASSAEPVALGAAILGCVAGGAEASGHANVFEAIRAMARVRDDVVYRPEARSGEAYEKVYALYREVTNPAGTLAGVMRQLRNT